MKEIDFLPEWYKNGRRRKLTYRTQYVALGGIFLIMAAWNFFAARTIAKAEAELVRITAGNTEVEAGMLKFAGLKGQVGVLQRQTVLIEEIDSKIDVASVLAELSSLIGRRIVLSKVYLVAEKFAEREEAKRSRRTGPVVRVGRARFSERQTLPLGDVRFKVIIAGVAVNAGDVAALVCKLEESPYFFQVAPSFSRNTEISPASSRALRSSDLKRPGQDLRASVKASEFEINCYLANYREL